MSAEEELESRFLKDFLDGKAPEETLEKVEDERYRVTEISCSGNKRLEIRDVYEDFSAALYDSSEQVIEDLESYRPEDEGRFGSYESEEGRVIYDRRDSGDAWISSDSAQSPPL